MINLILKAIKKDKITIPYTKGVGDSEIIFIEESFYNSYVIVEEKYESTLSEITIAFSSAYSSNTKTNYEIPTDNNGLKIYGIIKENGEVLLFNDYHNVATGEGNIEVEYEISNYDEDLKVDRKEYINQCTLLKNYTDNYSQNRCMFSGNSLLPAFDWYSTSVNVYALADDYNKSSVVNSDDLIYVPEDSSCKYGKTNSAIVGYSVLANGKLVVFKENKGDDPTIYFRECITTTNTNEDSIFYLNMFAGNIGSAPINKSGNGVINFKGDTLFVSSDKEIKGLDVSSNLNDTSNYASTRSYYLNNILNKLDLSQAFFIENKKSLYLFIPDHDTYITKSDSIENSQYNWYPIDLGKISATSGIALDNDLLLIGNDKGYLYLINANNNYVDNDRAFIGAANIAEIDSSTAKIIIPKSVISKVFVGDVMILKYVNSTDSVEKDLMFYVDRIGANVIKISAFDYVVNSNVITMIITGKKTLYVRGAPVSFGINDVGDEQIHFKTNVELFDGDELYSFIGTQELIVNEVVMNVEVPYVTVAMHIGSENTFSPIKLTSQYGDTKSCLVGYFTHRTPVESYLITKPYNMGTLIRYKNIFQRTIYNDTLLDSELKVGVVSNKLSRRESQIVSTVSSGRLGMDLAKVYFGSVDLFELNLPTRTFTVTSPLKQQIYTSFILFSDSAKNSVVSGMEVVYQVGTKIKGGGY